MINNTVLVTGDRGFIAGYLIRRLLDGGFNVVGIDNDWKYGPQKKDFDSHPNYTHYKWDAKDSEFLYDIMCRHMPSLVVAGAAWIGGISFFHELAYDLLSENEKITAAIFDATISYNYFKPYILDRILVISSSMVYESVESWPTREDQAREAVPLSTYGFQKLATEFFAQGAYEQHGIPYVIARPFNCVGIGEKRALVDKEVMSGNIKLAMSHVVPDLVQKIHKGQNPLVILGDGNQIRHYTAGPDLAEGLFRCLTYPQAKLKDFNLSTSESTTVLELAEMIWKKMKPGIPFAYEASTPFKYDVQRRIPDVSKAKHILGFEAKTQLSDILDEVIPWVTKMCDEGQI